MKFKKIISTLLIITMIFCMTFTHFAEDNDQNIDELIINSMCEIETESLVKDVNDIVNEDTDKEKNDVLENENNEDNKNVINSDEVLLESEAEVNKSIELIEESYEIKETEESTKIEETEDVRKAENAEEIEAIGTIETTNDIDEIISTISNINSTSDDGEILKMATISEVEIFSDVLTPWMWWYLTDDGHTIHYSSIEPVDGGHPVNTSPISYEGLAKEDITRAVIDDTINMQTGYEFFKDFNNLIEIENINNLDTSNVTNMDSMFSGCNYLTNLDVSGFNTGSVTSMNSMFSDCASLTNLDLSGFDTKNVTDMRYIFSHCYSLLNIDLSGFSTENVVYMDRMFYRCQSLTNIDVTSFNTENVTRMDSLFADCSSLISLDLSNFDTSSVATMYKMFYNCSNLTTIYANENFITSNITETSDATSMQMFDGCVALKGGNGTTYDSSHIDKEYARVDLEDNIGYFTYRGAHRVLNSISIVKVPNITTYKSGLEINLTGLVIELEYSDDTIEEVVYDDANKNEFEVNPISTANLITGNHIVTITYGGKSTAFIINVLAHSIDNTPSNSGGNSSGGGSGNGVEQSFVAPANHISNVKIIKRAIDATQISWEYNQVLNKWRMNIRIGEQMVPVEEGFYLVAGLNYQNINVMVTNLIGSDTYYFDKDGYMLTGWIHTIDNKWYYMRHFKDANEGKMVFGWYQIDNKWYYFATDGSMLVNTITPDGFIVGIDGAHGCRLLIDF